MASTQSLPYLVTSWAALETSLGAILRVKNFATQTKSEDKALEPYDLKKDWSAVGPISVKELSVSYR